MRKTLAVIGMSVFVLGACGADDSDGTAAPSSSQAAETAVSTSAVAGGHNEADVAFVQAMIPHHEQALEMAELAQTKAASEPVRALAGRISAAQGPEIEQMQGWLEQWGVDESADGMAGMGHGDMASPEAHEEDMTALEAASGVEFDRLFLGLMVEHHQGAIEMAGQQVEQGQHPDVVALARQIAEAQQAEIVEMQALLPTG